jgi:hypothetical protein
LQFRRNLSRDIELTSSSGVEIGLLEKYHVGVDASKELKDAAQRHSAVNVPVDDPDETFQSHQEVSWREVAKFYLGVGFHVHIANLELQVRKCILRRFG